MALQRLEAGVGARWRLASPRGRGGAWRLAARCGRAAACLEAGTTACGAWRVEAKAWGLDLRTADPHLESFKKKLASPFGSKKT